MWAKLPARIRADWENQKGQIIIIFVSLYFLILVNNWLNLFEHVPDLCSCQLSDEGVTAEKADDGGSEKPPKVTTVKTVPLSDNGVSKSSAGKMTPMHQTM